MYLQAFWWDILINIVYAHINFVSRCSTLDNHSLYKIAHTLNKVKHILEAILLHRKDRHT